LSPSEEIRLAAGQLSNCWLSRLAFVENESVNVEGNAATYSVAYTHEIEIDEVAPEDGEQSWALLRLNAEIEWRHPEEAEFERPFELSLTINGVFSWDPGVANRELVEAWLEWNGVYLLWPYLRSYITMITAASGLPALTIYTMRVPDPPPSPPADQAGATEVQKDAAQHAEGG
jgi:preprotein translocase subunit SecB